MAKFYEKPEFSICDYNLDVMAASGEGSDIIDVEDVWGQRGI